MSEAGQPAIHPMRVVRRGDLKDYKIAGQEFEWPIDVCQAWSAVEAGHGDAILLCKQFMSSTHVSQCPQLLCPASAHEQVSPADIAQLFHKPWSKDQVREYAKTARIMRGQPWNLFRAGLYLDRLVLNNQNQLWPPPPTLHWVFEFHQPGGETTLPA